MNENISEAKVSSQPVDYNVLEDLKPVDRKGKKPLGKTQVSFASNVTNISENNTSYSSLVPVKRPLSQESDTSSSQPTEKLTRTMTDSLSNILSQSVKLSSVSFAQSQSEKSFNTDESLSILSQVALLFNLRQIPSKYIYIEPSAISS